MITGMKKAALIATVGVVLLALGTVALVQRHLQVIADYKAAILAVNKERAHASDMAWNKSFKDGVGLVTVLVVPVRTLAARKVIKLGFEHGQAALQGPSQKPVNEDRAKADKGNPNAVPRGRSFRYELRYHPGLPVAPSSPETVGLCGRLKKL